MEHLGLVPKTDLQATLASLILPPTSLAMAMDFRHNNRVPRRAALASRADARTKSLGLPMRRRLRRLKSHT
jgi:hypothetical protein